jgi:hypothetical protein|tara:strand:- start:569 stop:730 length:162 start_codon:yes stop_codon:yes gene_type:complete
MSDELQSDRGDSKNAENVAPMDEVKDPNELSEEEQMEKFAEQLKEDDWGHQPC